MSLKNIDDNKSKIKQYALVRVGEGQLLKLYNSFNRPEKEFRAYLEKNKKEFNNGNIEYYAIREDDTYIVQLTLMHDNPDIKDSTKTDKRVYFNHLSIVKNKANIGFEKLLIELVIAKLQEDKKDEVKIFEYTISVGYRERNMKKILEDIGFEEYKEYINKDTSKKDILYLRKDKEI